MRPEWKPTLVERTFVNVFFTMMTKTYGKTSKIVIEEGVRTLGVKGYLRYAAAATKAINQLQKELGEADAQILIGLSSLFIGCGFCAYGHILAGDLLWYRDRDVLHPLHPDSVAKLFDMTDQEIRKWLEENLDDPQFERLRNLAIRLLDIHRGEQEGNSADDALLELCQGVWYWTTECTIVEGIHIQPDDAFPIHTIGKDTSLRERYDKARTNGVH